MPKSPRLGLPKYKTRNFTAKQKASPKLEDLDQPENLDRMKPDEALRMALGYSQNDRVAFEVAKKRLRDLLECHFDWNRSFTEQTSATWASVNSEIRQHIPEIYSTNEGYHATRQYMSRCFHARRWRRQQLGYNQDQDPEATERSGSQEISLPEDDSCEAKNDDANAARIVEYQADPFINQVIFGDSLQANTIVDPPARKRGRRPRKKGPSVSENKEQSVPPDHGPCDRNKEASMHLATMSAFPGLGSPPIYTDQPENPICQFLRSCKPPLEHLYPVFIRIGLETKADLEGVLDWGAQERVSWLMELSKEEWGLSRLNVKSLSLAFQVADQYESTLLVAGANSRTDM